MKLSQLSSVLGDCLENETGDCEISSLSMDSREKLENGLFFCVTGARFDAHRFAPQAVENGAVALVVERLLPDLNVPQVVVKNTRLAMPLMAERFYDYPAEQMKILGVTGTKGKTTISYLIKAIMEKAGYKVGLIGTTGNMIGDTFVKSELTTPDAIDLQKIFRRMADEGVQVVAMEVSAHALAMHRLAGVKFETGCYTNLSQDHLDYFGTMDNYFEAKKSFFDKQWLNNAAVNIDEETTARILSDINVPFITYGICRNADLAARNIEITEEGVRFEMRLLGMHDFPVHLRLTGMFNIYNALAAAAVGLNMGVDPNVIARALERVRAVPGRAEVLEVNLPFKVVLDYSHSPDALKNILIAMRDFVKGDGRIIALFGCGGDRDHAKRPMMGEIGGRLADYSILTSDNPRTEDPFEILKSVEEGIVGTGGSYVVIENRRAAIKHALQIAREGDIVILAGKGHETYQEIMGVKRPFDEKVVVNELIEEMKQE